MSQAFPDEHTRQLVDEQINLPSPPAIAVQILNTVQQEEFSLDDLEQIITADTALTGKMLRIANSAFYALPNQVTNVKRALSILGTNVIKNIALSFVIANDMKGEENSHFSFDYFWKRSVTSAVAAELLSNEIGRRSEDIFVTALLQDIGILLMYLFKGEEYAKQLQSCVSNGGGELSLKEQELYQFDHQQLGFLLLEDWGLPKMITQPILHHHAPQNAPEELQTTARVLDTSNVLSAIYTRQETAENYRALQSKMNDYFQLDGEKTRTILDQVAMQSISILDIFNLDSSDIKPYSELLQEANEELGKLNLSYEQLVLELKESKEKSERFANELRAANAKLEELAFRDGLTGLYNHRYFQEILDKEISRAKRYGHNLGLLMFDIDFFKSVNDKHGHPGGDKVLKTIAAKITEAIRPSDILARYGGEEFAVILPETNKSGVKVFAERLRHCIAAIATEYNGAMIKVTISSGGAVFNAENPITKQHLIDLADQGLYESKNNGRNRVTVVNNGEML